MNTYKNFLVVEAAAPAVDTHIKTHLSHLEDLAIERGLDGFNNFLEHINEMIEKIRGFETNQEINAKIDGSPMILFGLDPRKEFKNKFFLSLKGGLSKANPKILHTEADIEALYGTHPIKSKLKNMLKFLPSAYDNSGKIYQADTLFAEPTDKKKIKIGEEEFIAFKPNVIVYAVPVDPTSEISKRISAAVVGIIVHESFKGVQEGEGINLISAGRNVASLVQKSKRTNVFIESSNYGQVAVNIPDGEVRKLQSEVAKAKIAIGRVTPEFNKEYISSPVLALLKIFLNKQVDLGEKGFFGIAKQNIEAGEQELVVNSFIDNFRRFISERYGKEGELKKTPQGKANVETRLNQILSFLELSKKSIAGLIAATFHMTASKYYLWNILSKFESKLGRQFYQNKDGSFTPARDEGYVLFVGTNHVKIVDRLDFTKINRAEGGRQRTTI